METNEQTGTKRVRGRQGFASMGDEKKREIARLGGIAAQATGRAHSWTSLEAQAAGKKGGAISRRGKRDVPREEYEALRARIAQQIEDGE